MIRRPPRSTRVRSSAASDVYKRQGQYLRLYVNGTEVGKSAQTGLIKQSNGVLRLGGNSVWGEYFNGYIDEVRIYNRALTATEVGSNLATPIQIVTVPVLLPPTNLTTSN